MSTPLRGKTVALAEGRQLEELATLLQDEGAAVLRCPMLEILDARADWPRREMLSELRILSTDLVRSLRLSEEGL